MSADRLTDRFRTRRDCRPIRTMTREIAKLQDVEQQSLDKNSELPARSACFGTQPRAAVAGTDGALTTASAISMEALGNPHLFHFSLRSRCTSTLAGLRILQSVARRTRRLHPRGGRR